VEYIIVKWSGVERMKKDCVLRWVQSNPIQSKLFLRVYEYIYIYMYICIYYGIFVHSFDSIRFDLILVHLIKVFRPSSFSVFFFGWFKVHHIDGI